jgi:predicted amidophosphoribosyltransferase
MELTFMFVLSAVIFAMTWFILHSTRQRQWTKWEREFFTRQPTQHPNLMCVKCGAKFDVEQILEQPGAMFCPTCGSKESFTWLSRTEEKADVEG